jgi:peptidoglycan/LPS O-acetylase OafA/YrhL
MISHQRNVLMGISIILIMVFHFTEDCQDAQFHYEGFIQWFRTQIGSSSVDVFLFLSGLSLYYSLKKNPDILAFFQRRLVRILIPYVIVALPAWLFYDLVSTGKRFTAVIKDFTFYSFFSSGVKWYWYIGMILLCYMLFPYLFRIVENARNAIDGEMYQLAMIGSWTVFCLILSSYGGQMYKNTSIALLRLPFFIAGAFYGRSSYEHRRTYWKWCALLLFFVGLDLLIPANTKILSRYVPGVINLSVCALAAPLFTTSWMKPLAKLFTWFGNHSLELYLTHVTVRKFMKQYGHPTCYPANEVVMAVSSILLAWVLCMLSQKIARLFTRPRAASGDA